VTATRVDDAIVEVPLSPAVVPPRKILGWVVANASLLLLGVLFVLPLLWLVFNAFGRNSSAAIEFPHFTLRNFSQALGSGRASALWNSAYMSIISTIVSTVPAALAAYALSRFRIPLRRSFLVLILFLCGLPISIVVIPVYEIFAHQGWLTLLPTAIFLGVTSLPMEIWLIKGYIDILPIDMEEAARLEGVSHFKTLTLIVLPLTLPGVMAAALFGFINAWGSLLIPLILIANPSQQPASVIFPQFTSETHVFYGQIAAYSLVYALPVVILYLVVFSVFRGKFNLSGMSG
jgi:multiple sugar transport system permease protein